MSKLTTVRQELADALVAAGFNAVTEVPQTFSPPLCWVAPRTPYRQQGQTVARKRISLAVVCLAANATNATALSSVDDFAETVADTIAEMDGYILDPAGEIDAPELFPTAQGQQFLGAAVNVITEVTR